MSHSRRDAGTGSYSYSENKITGEGRWAWSLSYTDIDGNRKRIQFTAKSKKQLQERVERFLQERKDKLTPWENLTLNQWINRWLPTQKDTVKIKTYEYYEYMCRKHLSTSPLGHMQLKKITSNHIQMWLNSLLTVKKSLGDTLLSPGTVNSIRRALNLVLDGAVKQGLLGLRPQSKPVKQEKTKPLQITPEEMRAFLALAETRDYWDIDVDASKKQKQAVMIPENYRPQNTIAHVYMYSCYKTAVYFALHTLCRKGEIVGARWQDIDMDAKTFTVVQNIVYASHGITVGSPKTGQYRKILLSDSMIERLKEWKKQQQQYIEEVGDLFADDNDLIFTSHTGGVVNDRLFRLFWDKLTIAAGLKIRFHDLRHIGAATMLSNGVPIKAVQERGGWITTSVLLDTYAYCIPGLQQACVDVLDKNF